MAAKQETVAAQTIRTLFGVVVAGAFGTLSVVGKVTTVAFRTRGSLPRLKSLSRL